MQAGQGIFNHQTAARVALQGCCGGQVHIRKGFGARQVVAAEDVRVEQRQQAHFVQLHQHLGLVRAAGHGDLAAQQGMALLHGGDRAGDGLQVGVQPLVAQGVEGGHPGIGERLAGFAFDASGFAAHGFADEDLQALGLRNGPARGVEHGVQGAIGDVFAIDEHAVAIEQNGFKQHVAVPDLLYLMRFIRSIQPPNSAARACARAWAWRMAATKCAGTCCACRWVMAAWVVPPWLVTRWRMTSGASPERAANSAAP